MVRFWPKFGRQTKQIGPEPNHQTVNFLFDKSEDLLPPMFGSKTKYKKGRNKKHDQNCRAQKIFWSKSALFAQF